MTGVQEVVHRRPDTRIIAATSITVMNRANSCCCAPADVIGLSFLPGLFTERGGPCPLSGRDGGAGRPRLGPVVVPR